jgi:N-acetylmuramoyl-L-alanine amidase
MRVNKLMLQYVCASLLIVICAATVYKLSLLENNPALTASSTYELRTVILDAGHGGKDGGAVSVTGTAETVLNLDIVLRMQDVFEVLGYDVILTRETDTELSHADGGSRKMQDLKGRLEIARKNCGIPFISIHMNKFPVEKYKGLQIYYSPIPESKELAETIRGYVVGNIDSTNKRSSKPSGSAIYLLHHAVSPSVLIECGFLSNNEEAVLLDSEEYRSKLSIVIASAVDMWYNTYEIPKG